MMSLPLAHVFQCLLTFSLLYASCWLAEIWQLSQQGATGELELEFTFQRCSCKLSFLPPPPTPCWLIWDSLVYLFIHSSSRGKHSNITSRCWGDRGRDARVFAGWRHHTLWPGPWVYKTFNCWWGQGHLHWFGSSKYHQHNKNVALE